MAGEDRNSAPYNRVVGRKYFTYKNQVPLRPGQQLGFTPGLGFYALGDPYMGEHGWMPGPGSHGPAGHPPMMPGRFPLIPPGLLKKMPPVPGAFIDYRRVPQGAPDFMGEHLPLPQQGQPMQPYNAAGAFGNTNPAMIQAIMAQLQGFQAHPPFGPQPV